MDEIKLFELQCPRCGGQLKESGSVYKCDCCGKAFEKQVRVDVADQLRAVLNEQKQEAIANLRRQLWNEMQAQYINSARIVELARDIKKYLPEDYFANFCETANSANDRVVNAFLNNTSKEDMDDYADIVLDFMLKSAKSANLTAISLFIERAFKRDPVNYDKYITKYEQEAQKVNKGVYDLIITRDVFLAYSSADIDKVIELCDYLESQKITCFLALRNLRHGRGAVDNYDKALQKAIDNCKTVVFVSSTHSRSMTCDALVKELPYIKAKDLESAPIEFKRAYDRLPAEYRMPRVEYLIEDYEGDVAEYVTKEFFSSLEWCKNKQDVARRVLRYKTEVRETSAQRAERENRELQQRLEEERRKAKELELKIAEAEKARLEAEQKQKQESVEHQLEQQKKLEEERRKAKEIELKTKELELKIAEAERARLEAEKINAQPIVEKPITRGRKAKQAEASDSGEDPNAKYCKSCRTANRPTAKFCSNCGGREFFASFNEYLESKYKYCTECGAQNNYDDKFCAECGSKSFVPTEADYKKLLIRRAQEELQRRQEEQRRQEAERLQKLHENFEIVNGTVTKYSGRKANLEIADDVIAIGLRALKESKTIKRVTIPKSVKTINDSAFEGCPLLESVEIANGVTQIGNRAFADCPALVKINIPQSVTQLGEGAFDGCENLKDIVFENAQFGKTYLAGEKQRKKREEEERKIRENFDINGGVLLKYKGKGLKIVVPDRVTHIESNAFKDCKKVTSITLTSNVVFIGDNAFDGCSALTKINIPKEVKSIGIDAFENCPNLTDIVFENKAFGDKYLESEKERKERILAEILRKEREAEEERQRYIRENFIIKNNELIKYIGKGSNAKIPEGVTYIRDYAFENTNAKSLIVPQSVVSMGRYAFDSGDGKKKIALYGRDQTFWAKYNKDCEEQDKLRKEELDKTYYSESNFKKTKYGYIEFGMFPQSSVKDALFYNHPEVAGYYLNKDNRLCKKSAGLKEFFIGEPIKWKILDKSADRILMIATNILDVELFGEFLCDTDYSKSSVRTILNKYFYDKAFSDEQKKIILTTTVDNGKDKNTKDKVFLLSESEVKRYLDSDTYTKIKYTEYANDHLFGANGKWWLRTPNRVVTATGAIVTCQVNDRGIGYVPAIRVSAKEAEALSKKINENTQQEKIRALYRIANGIALKFYGYGGDLVLPDNITTVGMGLFKDNDKITSVVIPDGVTTIEDEAFKNCHNLLKVVIPKSVKNIGEHVFDRCEKLSQMQFADEDFGKQYKVKAADERFQIKNGVLTKYSGVGGEVEIPDTVTAIGASAFEDCNYVINISIPQSVTTIENEAFKNCTSLQKIVIPKSVKKIGEGAFAGCSHLADLVFEDEQFGEKYISDEFFDITDGTVLKYKGFIANVVIPKSVTAIKGYAFEDCLSVKSVAIPQGVTKINSYTFRGCTNLSKIFIPKSVTTIVSGAFAGCPQLKDLVFEDEEFGKEYFLKQNFDIADGKLIKYKGKDGEVIIPDSVTSIEEKAFYNCNTIKSITIPASVKKIGSNAFLGCSSLIDVHISDIGAWCKITFANMDANPLSAAHRLYLNGQPVTSVTFSEGVNSFAFVGCNTLTSVNILQGKAIGACAFKGCTALADVQLPEGLNSINKMAFEGCAIRYIKLPESLASIEYGAFMNCRELKDITIPEKVTNMGETVFSGCVKMRDIYCRVKKPLLGMPKGWAKNWAGNCSNIRWNYK